MQLDWLEKLGDLAKDGTAAVLVTIAEAKGSTPRETGVKMVVTKDEQFGTIGGGQLEFEAIEEARKLLQNDNRDNGESKLKLKDYPLGPQLKQCCGGHVKVMLEPFLQHHTNLLLFGAGHVGKEIVETLKGLDVRIIWIDEREEEFADSVPNYVKKQVTANIEAEIEAAPSGSYILVMTHRHDLDFQIIRAALKRRMSKNDIAYIGLIGSKTKRVRFEKNLIKQGIDNKNSKSFICPIGIDGLNGKHPREIAIAVAAEMIQKGLGRG